MDSRLHGPGGTQNGGSISFFLSSFNIFSLKDNCFTEFCCFFVKPQHETAIGIYIYALPIESSSHLPPHPMPLG